METVHGGAGGLEELYLWEQCSPEGCTPWYGAVLGQCWDSCRLWESHMVSVWKGRHLWEGPHMEQRQRVIMRKQQRLTEPQPQFPIPLLHSQEEAGWEERCSGFVFSSHSFSLLVVDIKLQYSPYTEFVLPVTVTVKESHLSQHTRV